MTAKFQLVAHPELQAQLRDLHAKAQRDPSGLEAKQFAAIRTGLAALRNGREADFDGERLGYSDRHPDLRDCAELKLPVVEEVNRRGRPMGPSHRLIYREFDGATADQLPVRQVMAFEPRKDGRPFEVAANRLGRTRGAPLAELDSLPNLEPAVGPAKDPSRPVSPVRRPLPPELAQAMKGLEGVPPASRAATPPGSDQQRPTSRDDPRGSPTRDR
ncbi:hypothetical protein F1D05_37605 [Kribbella qitaiheensis]|uniref:Uncharacterized protein n=1 Tax=Kribbella qitaiheensis TaxID=1544730 RepID=A0A7G6X8K7_9ACTN|nr:hypothetical protein [Kribbella qitaiheensis]QNE22572.1 hypothetical protein F1D05_37605 [Kribbella qitaiheensis]